MITNEAIGIRLKRVREDLKISQANIAKELGISLSAWRNYENGSRDIKKDILIHLWDNYQVDPSWLLVGRESASNEANKERKSTKVARRPKEILNLPAENIYVLINTLFKDIESLHNLTNESARHVKQALRLALLIYPWLDLNESPDKLETHISTMIVQYTLALYNILQSAPTYSLEDYDKKLDKHIDEFKNKLGLEGKVDIDVLNDPEDDFYQSLISMPWFFSFKD